MKIKFLVDYRGKLTGEKYYTAGTEVEDGLNVRGQALVDAGRAEVVVPKPPPKPQRATPKTVPVPVKPKRARKPRAKK